MFQCRWDGELSIGRKANAAVRVPHPAAADREPPFVRHFRFYGLPKYKEEVFLCPCLKLRFQKSIGRSR